MPEWFEDESLWIETYPFTFSEQRFAMAEEEVKSRSSRLWAFTVRRSWISVAGRGGTRLCWQSEAVP